MTTRVPLAFRARALALLGGSFRLGIFIGPFVTAALLEIFGSEHAAIWFFLACLISLVVLVLFGPDPEKTILPAQTAASPAMSEDTGEAVTGPLRVPRSPRQAGVFQTMCCCTCS